MNAEEEAGKAIGRWSHTQATGELVPPDELLPEPYVLRRRPTAVWRLNGSGNVGSGTTNHEITANHTEYGLAITVGRAKDGGEQGDQPLSFARGQIPELIAILTAAYRWKDGESRA